MSKEKTKTIDMKHKTFGAVREGERELYFTQQGKCLCKPICNK